MRLLDTIACQNYIHCQTHHPRASYQSTVSQLQIHPSLSALYYLRWNQNIFPAGTKTNFVGREHWRRKRFALLVPVCFFLQAPAVYLQCPVVSSMWHLSMGRWLCSSVLLVGHSPCDQLPLEPPGSFTEE